MVVLRKFLLFFSLILSLSSCCAHKATKDEFRYLFVVLSKYGEIKKGLNGNYQMILDHEYVDSVVAFSDRPYRVVKHLTGEEFLKDWNTHGPNSFPNDPPNAAVIINNHLQTVELLDMNIEGTKMTFSIRSDGERALQTISGTMQLFIDGWCHSACICPPCAGLGD